MPSGYLPKSRYISTLNEETIRKHWPKFSPSIVESIVQQPFQFDKGTSRNSLPLRLPSSPSRRTKDLDRLIKEENLETFASLTRNAVENRSKDYDKICSMMDSIVFEPMTMIGSREALIRPVDPSLLNRASSSGAYPFPSVRSESVRRRVHFVR